MTKQSQLYYIMYPVLMVNSNLEIWLLSLVGLKAFTKFPISSKIHYVPFIFNKIAEISLVLFLLKKTSIQTKETLDFCEVSDLVSILVRSHTLTLPYTLDRKILTPHNQLRISTKFSFINTISVIVSKNKKNSVEVKERCTSIYLYV